jgi:hypothetical protein
MKIGHELEQVFIEPRKSLLSHDFQIQLHTPMMLPCGVNWHGVPLVVGGNNALGSLKTAKTVTSQGWLSLLSSSATGWSEYKNHFLPTHEQRIAPEHVIVSKNLSLPQQTDVFEGLEAMKTSVFVSISDVNAYGKRLPFEVKQMRRKLAKHAIIAGPVSTPEGVEMLIEAGADVIRISNPPQEYGIRVPTFTMIQECSMAARSSGAKVMYDAAQSIDEIIKAYAAGADFVVYNKPFKNSPDSDINPIGDGESWDGYAMHSVKTGEPMLPAMIETQEYLRNACVMLSAAALPLLRERANFIYT